METLREIHWCLHRQTWKKYKGNGKMLSDLTELNIRLDVIGQASILSIMKKGLKR